MGSACHVGWAAPSFEPNATQQKNIVKPTTNQLFSTWRQHCFRKCQKSHPKRFPFVLFVGLVPFFDASATLQKNHLKPMKNQHLSTWRQHGCSRVKKKLHGSSKQAAGVASAFRDDMKIIKKPLVLQYICLLGVLGAVGRVGTALRATKCQRAPPKVTSGSPNVAPGSKMLIFRWFYNGF